MGRILVTLLRTEYIHGPRGALRVDPARSIIWSHGNGLTIGADRCRLLSFIIGIVLGLFRGRASMQLAKIDIDRSEFARYNLVAISRVAVKSAVLSDLALLSSVLYNGIPVRR